MIGSILIWYLVVQGFALAGLPLAFGWLRALPSRGYAAAKALGVLLVGVLLWWGGILHIWGNTAAATLVAMGGIFALGLWAMRGQWADVRPWQREHRRFVLVTEALFLMALILWSFVRASQPQLQTAGGEKWMEIAFLNAVLRSPAMPPHDPWLSGYAISYYYLGYHLLGMITRLTALPASIAFNLGNAGWFALAAATAYGVAYDLLNRRDALRPLLGPVMLLLAGNGAGLLEVLHARGLLPAAFWRWLDIVDLNAAPEPPYTWAPTRFFWWWRASRVIRDVTPWGDHQEVIDEFPAFSFILGDMHPHLLALPFVLLVIALAFHLYKQALERDERPREDARWWASIPKLSGYAVVLGTLGFLNTWDFPLGWALLVGALLIGHLQRRRAAEPDWHLAALFDLAWDLKIEAIFLGVGSLLCYAPFWLGLRSQAGGILPNLFNATRLPQFVVMFTPLLIPVGGVIVNGARRARLSWKTVAQWAVLGLVGIAALSLLIGSVTAAPYLIVILRGESVQGYNLPPETALAALRRRLANPWTALLLLVGVSAGGLALLGFGRNSRDSEQPARPPHPIAAPFPLMLALLGLLLTLAPEFVFLKDIFHTRMNTIFKFYFQAWILWSVAGAWQVARWLERPRGRKWAALAGVLILIGMIYTGLAIPKRAEEHGAPWTLDGAAWLEESHPADYAAIQWLNANVEGRPVIAETPGDERRAYTYEGRIAAHTGLPTVLGWADHEKQWRGTSGEQDRRAQALEALFTTENPERAREVIAQYQIAYIYIGPVESARYPDAGLTKFATMFPSVYESAQVVIYRTGHH